MRATKVFLLLLSLVIFIFSVQGQPVPFQFSEQSQKWGFKNKTNEEIVIYWHFTKADSFNKYGLAKVTYHNREGCIDTSGRVVVPFYYQHLVNCNGDTVLVSTKRNRCLIKKNKDYYEYENGLLFTDLPLRSWPVKELDIITFSYPRDKELIQTMITHQRQKDIKILPDRINNEFSYSMVFGSGENLTLEPSKHWPTSSTQFKYTKLINASLTGNRHGNLGITTGYLINKYWVDTAVIKTNQLFIGLSHRIYLGNHAYINIGAYPIINQLSRSHRRGASHWNFNTLTYSLSSTFESSLNFILGKNVLLGLGYKYLPTPYYRSKLQRNYLGLNLGFQL